MKLREDNTGDSLWLLLDTICNAFGGMLLIAILFALFSSQVHVTEKANHMADLNGELQERRLALAEHDLDLAQQANARLQTLLAGSDLATRVGLVTKRNELRAADTALRGTTARLNTSITDLRNTTQAIPEDRLNELRGQMDAETRRKTEQENSLAAATNNVQRLQARLADLQNQTKAERQAHIVNLRLPKENAQSKASFPVIIRYGRVYFVHDPNRAFAQNDEALNFEPESNDDTKVTPIRGRGVDLFTAARLLPKIPSDDFYIVCWVYGDSFGAFNEFKAHIIKTGHEYGWTPMEADESLRITSQHVKSPPPL